MKRVVLGLLGVLLALVGLSLLASGSALLALFGTDGRTAIPIGAVTAPEGRAVVLTDFQISSSTPVPVNEAWFALQVKVAGDQSHFVGVAPKTEALRYLQGVPYSLVSDFDSSAGAIDATTIPGDARPADPQRQRFWQAQQVGRQVAVDWPVADEDTTLVVMNEDGTADVDATITVLLTIAWAGTAGIGIAVAGLVLIVLAIVALVVAFRSRSDASTPSTGWQSPSSV